MMLIKKWFGCLVLFFYYFTSVAQVAVRFEPRHKVALENKYIRLLNVRVLPGDTSLFHIHEIPSFFIPLSTTAIGSEVKGQLPQESRFNVGATWYNGFENGPLIHRVWNSDTTPLHIIDLELLAISHTILPSTIQIPGSNIVFENEKLRAYKFEISSNQTLNLPSLKTPMLFISLAGPELQIQNLDKKDVAHPFNAGNFQWVEAGQNFIVSDYSTAPVNVILILLK